MKDLPDDELIRIYIHAAARESSDLPFGAEARRKEAGDELLARGITEIQLPAFVDPFPVKGSDVDARKRIAAVPVRLDRWAEAEG